MIIEYFTYLVLSVIDYEAEVLYARSLFLVLSLCVCILCERIGRLIINFGYLL